MKKLMSTIIAFLFVFSFSTAVFATDFSHYNMLCNAYSEAIGYLSIVGPPKFLQRSFLS